MKKIAVTGGKGGTGKSTVAFLLVNKFLTKGKNVLLVDCDVECPNDHLLAGEKLGKPAAEVTAPFPVLNKKKCTKCGKCAEVCRENAIFQKPGEYPQFLHDLCSSCGACWEICPEGAIEKEQKEIGKIYLNSNLKYQMTNGKEKESALHLVTGEAKAHLEETGPVVKETLEYGESLAQEKNIDIILIDTAAGTHCPVINALLAADQAYAVTEPTPMGAYDLELILKLLEKIKIPAKIILNQADLGSRRPIYSLQEKFNVDLKAEINYSKKLAQAYSSGKLLNFDFKTKIINGK